jgi:hypothetical protein
MRNRVAGNPVGVVAVRIGGNTAGFEELVRIGDTRDPNLAGKLSVAGAVNVASSVNIGQDPAGATGDPCVRIAPNGSVVVGCSGAQLAVQNASGSTVVGTGTIQASGQIAGAALRTGQGAESSAVTPQGLTTTGKVQAAQGLSGDRLALEIVTEGSPCSASGLAESSQAEYAALATGGLATCQGGIWATAARYGVAGADCAPEDTQAVEAGTQQGLICKQGVYMRVAALMSNFVLLETAKLTFEPGVKQQSLNKPTCPSSGGQPAQLQLILIPGDEGPASTNAVGARVQGINRYADTETDTQWIVHLDRDDGQALEGVVLVSIYCFYPLGR